MAATAFGSVDWVVQVIVHSYVMHLPITISSTSPNRLIGPPSIRNARNCVERLAEVLPGAASRIRWEPDQGIPGRIEIYMNRMKPSPERGAQVVVPFVFHRG